MKNYFYFLSILLIFTGCSKYDNSTTSITDQNFIYPLKVGNNWQYACNIELLNIQPDTADISSLGTAIQTTSEIFVKQKIKLPNSIETYMIHERYYENDIVAEGDSYYNNTQDGLYFYAYKGYGKALPKRRTTHKLQFKGYSFYNVHEIKNFLLQNHHFSDSLFLEDPPLKVLHYPLAIDAGWYYRFAEQPFAIFKKVIGVEKITVPTGEYECYVVRYFYDFGNNGEWDDDIELVDYISPLGLIKRELIVKNITSNEEPNVTFDYHETIELINMTLL